MPIQNSHASSVKIETFFSNYYLATTAHSSHKKIRTSQAVKGLKESSLTRWLVDSYWPTTHALVVTSYSERGACLLSLGNGMGVLGGSRNG